MEMTKDKTMDAFLETIADIVDAIPAVEAAGGSPALQRAKISALCDTFRRIQMYRAEGIREDLVAIVLEKRKALIMDAGTVQDVNSICSEPKPHYYGGEFRTGRFSVPEEEMIMWSLASLRAPLNHDATERYMYLFKEAFGYLPWEVN